MKMDKKTLSVSISLFSTLILGSMFAQQVKADTTSQEQAASVTTNANTSSSNSNQNTSVDQSNLQTPTDTKNKSQPTNLQTPVATNLTPSPSENTLDDPSTQAVNITFNDQNNNQVVDSSGTPYTFSGNYDVGSTINYSDLATKVSSDLNGGYTLNDGQDITVKDGDNNYVLNVTAKTINNISVSLRDPNGNTDGVFYNNSATVGQKSDVLIYNKSSNYEKIPITDVTFHGYGYSHLAFNNLQNIPNTNSDGTVTLTYDMLPTLEKTYQSNINGYVLYAITSVPLEQTITIHHIDDLGAQIPNSTNETITGYKTDDIIENPYLIATEKNINGYTYTQNAQPFKVNYMFKDIQLIYTKNSLNYLKVNYVEKDTGKTIYTDYLRGTTGDSVNIKDISDINGLRNYKMTDSSTIGNYIINSDNETLNLNVVKKDPLTTKIVQSINGSNNFTTKFAFNYDDKVSYEQNVYLSNNLSDINIINGYLDGELVVSYDQETIQQLLANAEIDNMSTSELFEALFGGGIVDDEYAGHSIQLDVTYTNSSDKTANVSYQTADGDVISTQTLPNNSAGTDIGTSVESNLPQGYELVDSDNPYTISSVTDNSIELISQIQKISNSNNSGGSNSSGSSNSSDGSNNNSGNITAISETLSAHPNLSTIKVYNDSGNITGTNIQPNSDWFTDEKMELNGNTYYRIATNQWVNANDIYLYYNNATYVKTYSDSTKELVDSQNKTITDRKLSANSDWFSDRYTYINGQKYYRVATNEWVSAQDGLEYQPTDETVQASANAKLFDEYGNFITSAPSIGLKTDKIATINESKMYRVASNEWLPITDVQ